ncbi:MAG TPA: right-handed parallel beta-helix repeat-containing protein [Cytophagales bacterium]|nr:right-handed parallel beta-helix repeat-containing protein [Cytophagales bacterium]
MKTLTLKLNLIIILLSVTWHLQAKTLYLNAPSYNSALQALVNQCVAGDIIILRAGSHYVTTPIVFGIGRNGVTVRGENGAVVRKAQNSWNAAAFEISGNNNTIDNIDLDGGNLPEAGIIIYGQRNTISNSKIHNCGNSSAVGAGILLHNSGNPVCALNTVIGCKVYYNYMVGISQNGHSDGRIQDNQIYENGAEGLTVDIHSHNNYIFNNWIHRNNAANRGVGGVGIDFSNGNQLIGNTIDYTVFKSGITFQNNIGGCDGTIVRDNRINFNEGYGILERFTQYQNTNSLFQNNELTGNRLGTHHVSYTVARLGSDEQEKAGFSEELSMYPNPSQGHVTFDFGKYENENISIVIKDLQGKVLHEKNLTGGRSYHLNNTDFLKKGAYIVKLTIGSSVKNRKLIVD